MKKDIYGRIGTYTPGEGIKWDILFQCTKCGNETVRHDGALDYESFWGLCQGCNEVQRHKKVLK